MILSKIIEESAKKYPEKIAICFDRRKITYRELNSYANRLARGLKDIGVKKGDIVAILLPNIPEFVICYFAVIKLGATVLPLNPHYRQFELKCFLPHSTTSCIITCEETLPVVLSLKEELSCLKAIISTGKKKQNNIFLLNSIMRKYSSHPVKENISKDTPAALLYTSGVTTSPRGALLTHNNLFSNIVSILKTEKIKKEDIVLCALPLFHSFAMTVCMLAPLYRGAKIYLMDRFVPHLLVDTIYKHNVSIFLGVPTMFAYILNEPGLDRKYFSSLRLCLSGGAALSPEIIKQFKEKFGVEILEGYGLTEASPVVCYNSSSGLKKLGSVGLPLPSVEVKVVDEEGKEVKPGDVGEIIVKGPNVMAGYYNDPLATSEAIKDGWLCTGDLGKYDEDGYFYIVGRKKDVIIVSGFNVYPQEIEDCLLSHPDVVEAAVVGKHDRLKGEALKAYVVLKENSDATYEDIMEHCRKHLAPYKVPRYLEIRESLPKSDTGKILKSELM